MSERTNCGRCGGDRFLTSWEDKVRCPECGNADPDDVPAPAAYAPRAEEPEAPSGGEAKIEPAEVLLGRILEAIDEVELAHYGDRDIADSIHALRELVERIPPLCRRLTADLARAAEERDYNAQQIEQAALLTESQSGIIADYDDRLKVVQAQLATARAEELEYTVQESFVIQPVVPFSGCQGDYSTVDNIPIWDILKYLRRSRDASA